MPSNTLEQDIARSKELRAGTEHYRSYVGPPAQYDFMGNTQFRLLTSLGLREEHNLLDIGCGSLRAGKFLIQYLLPERYTGVEPNNWLWETALENEIGYDIQAIKKPTFVSSADFALPNLPRNSFDFAVAQSIYSHAGSDAVQESLKAVFDLLRDTGQFLFTTLTETSPGYENIPQGKDIRGWTYPPCVGYPEQDVFALCHAAGFAAERLEWFHPRQTWFRAVKQKDLLLTPPQKHQLGTGKPLFDPRFEEV